VKHVVLQFGEMLKQKNVIGGYTFVLDISILGEHIGPVLLFKVGQCTKLAEGRTWGISFGGRISCDIWSTLW